MTVGKSSSILSDLVNLSAAADCIIVAATSENIQCDVWIAKSKHFIDETWRSINICNEHKKDISVSKFPELSDFIGKVPAIILPNLNVVSQFFEPKSVSKIKPKTVISDVTNTISQQSKSTPLQHSEKKLQEIASTLEKNSKFNELLASKSETGKTNLGRSAETQVNSTEEILNRQEHNERKLNATSAKTSFEELGIKSKYSNKIKFDNAVPSVSKEIKKSNPSNGHLTRSKSSKQKVEEDKGSTYDKCKTPKSHKNPSRQSKRFRTPKAEEETNTLKKRKIYETPEFSRKPENKISSVTVNPMISNKIASSIVKTSNAVFINPTNLDSMMLKNRQNERENSTKKATKRKPEKNIDPNAIKEKLQMKLKQEANEKKQKREEKMERTQQKRLKLEKEREERVKQRESKNAAKVNDKVKESGKKGKISRAPSNLDPSKVISSTPLSKTNKTPCQFNKATTSKLISKELNVKEVINVAPNQQPIIIHIASPVLNNTYVLAEDQGDVTIQGSSEKTKPVLVPLSTNVIRDNQQNSGSDAKKCEKEPAKGMNETFCQQKPFNNYEMTPPVLTEFSSYDISDIKSDDESDSETSLKKPIPLWAQGMRLKNALYQKHYKQSDSDDVFGTVINMPNLDEIFGVMKKKYMHRSSSAVWHNTPERF